MFKLRYYWIFLFGVLIIGVLIFQFTHYSQTKIIVAVVDTGLDLRQIKFRLTATQGFNVLNHNKPPQDDNGHGTQIASIIHFLEPRIKIMPIKAIPKSGIATKQELAQGIIFAVDLGAKIINISAGVISPSPDLEQAIRYAEEKGVVIVAAAGGNGVGIEYPARYPIVLAVGGVDRNNERLSNSNTGLELDVVALGEYVTIGLRGECRNGTSFLIRNFSLQYNQRWNFAKRLWRFAQKRFAHFQTKRTATKQDREISRSCFINIYMM